MRTLSCTHAPYYGRICANIISALRVQTGLFILKTFTERQWPKSCLDSESVSLYACAMLSDNDVTLVDLYSSGTPKQRIKPLNRLLSTCRDKFGIHSSYENRKYARNVEVASFVSYIIQIFHCFEDNIPECLSRGSRESPRCYISRRRRRREI